MPYIEAAQAQKHVTHNEALRILDGVTQLSVIDRDLTAPPGGESDGDRYIIASSATGAWSGKDLNIAFWQDGAWRFLVPREGWRCWIEDEGIMLVYDNNNWFPLFGVRTPNGAQLFMPTLEEELTALSGPSVESNIDIPNGSWVQAVACRTTTLITGATSYSVGVTGELTKFGSGLSVSAGASNFGLIGGQAYYADTPIVITPAGGDFTGGAIRISILCHQVVPPQS